MINRDSQLLNEFKANRKKYMLLEDTSVACINKMISDNHFFVMQVMHRTKDADSLAGKFKRKSGKYHSLLDITDLVGIRIICYFSDTVDEIAEQLTQIFDIDWENSIDKRAALSATQFGYLSLHYICSLGANVECDESIKGIPFEIQIRTVLQHAWAEIEHDLGYKSDFSLPRAIVRLYSQTAGLLEVADRQFIEIRDSSNEYTRTIREKIASNTADDISLDRISLREYMRINKEYLAFLDKMKAELNVEVEEADADSFLEQFRWFGIEYIGQVKAMFEKQKEYVYSKIKNMAEEYEIDIISSNIILRNLCYGELISEKYAEEQIRKFLSLSISDEKKREKQLKQLLER